MGYHGVDSASADIVDEMGLDVVVAASGGQGCEDLLGRGVGHGLDVVSQGRAKFPDWPQDLLPFLERPAVAHRHDAHFGSVVGGAQAAYGVQLIGALPGEVAVEPQVLFGLRKGVEQHARQHHRTHGMELVLKGGDHAKVAAAAPDAPEEVLVLTGADVAELTVGGDDIGGDEVVAGQAVPARQPADAAPQGEAGDARVGVGAAGVARPKAWVSWSNSPT